MEDETRTVTALLQKARDRISEGFTAHTFARNAEGDCVDAAAEDATCWCTLGALERAACDLFCRTSWWLERGAGKAHKEALALLCTAWGYTKEDCAQQGYTVLLADKNDAATQQVVLAIFDRALKLSSAQD